MTTDRSHLNKPLRPASGLYVGGSKTYVQPVWSGLSLLDDAISRLPVIDDPDQPLDLGRRLRDRDKVRHLDETQWKYLVSRPSLRHRSLRALSLSGVGAGVLPWLLRLASVTISDDGVLAVATTAPPPGTVRDCLLLADAAGLVLFDCLPGPAGELRLFLRTARNHDPLPRDCTLRLFEAMRANKPNAPCRSDPAEEVRGGRPEILPTPARYTTHKRRST